MYEMCVGPQTGSAELVWHVVARQGAGSLCGIELSAPVPGAAETNRHCLPCMTRFQQLLDVADKHGADKH
ncbi:hypothetical protein OG985_41280 [Streptomyces sp. NBC_00289]|uniref:hypothetical protein n=1 Tax=Streptomyces sp. NBC_00289 TaxID=2975703 RepID=UPI0032439716